MQVSDKIIMLSPDEIHPYEKNPRRNSKTVELLVKAIPKVGFNVPLVLDKDHVIVKGHARFMAAKQLGMEKIPCIISDADPETIKADRIADNKVFEFSKWVHDELMHEVDMLDIGLDLGDFGLATMKFDDFEVLDAGEEDEENQADEEERRSRYLEMLQNETVAEPVFASQKSVDYAKSEQRAEPKAPPNYYSVICEKCGATMYVREGDAMTWE